MFARAFFVTTICLFVLTGCGDSSGGKIDAERQKELQSLRASIESLNKSTESLKKSTEFLNMSVAAMKESADARVESEKRDQSKPSTKGPTYSSATMDMWFYDVEADKLFIDKADKYPPIDAPSGGKAFKAYVFTCGACGNEKDRFVGYYEGFTDEYKERMRKAQEAAKTGNAEVVPEAALFLEEGFANGRLISINGKEWVESNSVDGIAINTELSKACEKRGGGQLRPCYPGMK